MLLISSPSEQDMKSLFCFVFFFLSVTETCGLKCMRSLTFSANGQKIMFAF